MPKITGATLDTIRDALCDIDTDARRAAYRAGNFPRADRVKDLDKRYRWDLLWASGMSGEGITRLYDQGCNDTHIDTALRSIVPPLSEGAPT